jgi:8-oxo-dGTP pyrophosphatase MutT (NUDIX family)
MGMSNEVMSYSPLGPTGAGGAANAGSERASGALKVVRAAGGAIWRRMPTGTEVVLIFRPRYQDWGLPKGKAHTLETDEAAALREVLEETGLQCRLGRPLPSTTYPDRDGRLKTVRYWAMTVEPRSGYRGGPLKPGPEGADEVASAQWVPMAEVRSRLTYARDVVVIDALAQHLATLELDA